MAKIEVGKVSEIPVGQMKSVTKGDNRILVANVEGKLHAMRAICHHEGGPLDEGTLSGKEVTCPWHGSMWDVTTGKLIWFATHLEDEPIYPVIIEGEKVFVEA
ncbi:MAG: Rieske 2Fe-2S domain-containing protein [Candidatus Micrarchaeota archaeon]|nr:Rieske 2Fe-2S domain-containing protein [Candidatus Micrarchaeota archaeon]